MEIVASQVALNDTPLPGVSVSCFRQPTKFVGLLLVDNNHFRKAAS